MVKEIKVVQPLNLKPVIKSDLCDYSDAYILVTGDITATRGDANTKVVFKNFAPLTNA